MPIPTSFDSLLEDLVLTTEIETSFQIKKFAICTHPLFELKNYLYDLYQSITEEEELNISDIAVENFFRGRDTIISIDRKGSEFNLRISSSKTGIKSWHKNHWCANKDKVAYVILNPLELNPFSLGVEELIEEVELREF